MKYQKIINLLDNTPNQPSKFRTANWVEINDECWSVACGTLWQYCRYELALDTANGEIFHLVLSLICLKLNENKRQNRQDWHQRF